MSKRSFAPVFLKMKDIYIHPVLGELLINRSSRAKRVSITVRPSEVRLTLPQRYPLARAVSFAESKQDWIERAKKRAEEKVRPLLVITPPFSTRFHELNVVTGNSAKCVIKEGQTLVTLPEHISIESEAGQKFIRQSITESLRAEAREFLPKRVSQLAKIHGFSYTALSFRNARSRWGSCSGKNTISLSINLMLLPDHLIDYVILHELCHTREKNHGPKFHTLLNEVTGGLHRQFDRELKGFVPKL